MIYKILLFVILTCFSGYANADTTSHRKAAEEVLLLMKIDKIMAPAIKQIQQAQIRELQKLDLPDEAIETSKKYLQQTVDILVNAFQWEKWKEDLIDSYVGVYTEPELDELIEFYKSPLGQKMVEKTPRLTMETVQLSQKLMKRVSPDLKAITDAMLKELREKYSK